MIDIVQLLLKAGSGGHGWVSFRREKFVPKGGPDGGDGGDGGSLIIRATKKQATLAHFAGVSEVVAQSGRTGGKKKMIGATAEDEVLEVPLGTVIWQRASRYEKAYNQRRKYYVENDSDPIPTPESVQPPLERDKLDTHAFSSQEPGPDKVLIARLTEEGQEVVVCHGGRGGRGNTSFKNSIKTTPLEAEYGAPGEERLVVLELELLADVGLVGLPNAGKSTFLSRVSKAQPKIANYPFTTLSPHLGVWQINAGGQSEAEGTPQSVVVADIPGLIEGASQGKGLGHDFLRHVKNCQVLLFVIYLPESVVFDESVSVEEKAQQAWEQYQLLDDELRAYSEQLTQKPRLIALNKADLYSEELQQALKRVFADHGEQFHLMSGATAYGLAELGGVVGQLLTPASNSDASSKPEVS